MRDYTTEQFLKDLDEPYAWPGGYPRYFVTSDGAALSYKAAEENKELIIEAIKDKDNSGWRVIGADINFEDGDLYCDHSGNRIESAYAEPEGDDVKCPHCGEITHIGGLIGPTTDDCPHCGNRVIYN